MQISTHKGIRAVSVLPSGYLTFKIDNVTYYVHKYVWEEANGPTPVGYEVDHIDRDKTNNHLSNLRLATVSENRCNTGLRADNACGIKGLHTRVYKGSMYWCAQISKDGKRYTKSSKDADIVYAWLNEQRATLHGEFQSRG